MTSRVWRVGDIWLAPDWGSPGKWCEIELLGVPIDGKVLFRWRTGPSKGLIGKLPTRNLKKRRRFGE
jgi:hypothetical protein